MLEVSQTPAGLVLDVPSWIGIAILLLGLGLVVAVALAATPKGRALVARWPALERIPMAPWVPLAKMRMVSLLVAVAGGLLLVHAGTRFLTTSTLFEQRGVIVNGLMGEED